jgi:hypothetical protein
MWRRFPFLGRSTGLDGMHTLGSRGRDFQPRSPQQDQAVNTVSGSAHNMYLQRCGIEGHHRIARVADDYLAPDKQKGRPFVKWKYNPRVHNSLLHF